MKAMTIPARTIDGLLWMETTLSFEVYPARIDTVLYDEILIYINAKTVFDRDNGVIAISQFADMVLET